VFSFCTQHLDGPDARAQAVRLVSNKGVQVVFNFDRERASFAPPNGEALDKQLEDLNQLLRPGMDRALRALNYGNLRRFAERTPSLDRWIQFGVPSFANWIHNGMQNSNYELVPSSTAAFLLSRTDQSIELHAAVFEELEESRLTEVVSEFSPQLESLPDEAALPRFDDELISHWYLDYKSAESVEASRWTLERHRTLLSEAQSIQSRLTDAAPQLQQSTDRQVEGRSTIASFSDWSAAGLRILAGTGLTVANATFGLTVGLTTTILSHGGTAVPAYIGVAKSIHLGLVQVANGLEKVSKLAA
jgi:hypothetical protein